MVELNGMLVSASAAQRRQFFSALIQRASKKRRGLGGGSLTLLLALPGVPASGERTVAGAAALASGGGAPVAMENYQHLSPELKAKLAAALAAKAKQQTAAGAPSCPPRSSHGLCVPVSLCASGLGGGPGRRDNAAPRWPRAQARKGTHAPRSSRR